ncbi:MAG TPA: hypothetical protein VFX15_03120 [Actinomycetes bacterium]|nr:hypothetical protein [Actinomycetes bacterium]
MDVNYDMLPEHMREPLRDYVERGEAVGGFLTAVLSNNLVDAFGYADQTNKAAMESYAQWLYNECPRKAWGSIEKVIAWREAKGDL